MRIDKYLKVARLLKRREAAAEACESGRVLLNGKPAKPSARLKVGDLIEIRFSSVPVCIRVLSLQECIRKEDAASLYEPVSGS